MRPALIGVIPSTVCVHRPQIGMSASVESASRVMASTVQVKTLHTVGKPQQSMLYWNL